MKKQNVPDNPESRSIVILEPKPNVIYSVEVAAHLAGVPRRSMLVYCRAGFVRPVLLPPYGVMAFTEEAIYTVRRVEYMRTVHNLDMGWIKNILDLLDEVERLRAEVRFLRNY